MVKKGKDYDSVSETGNWNVAAEYARFKILEPLRLADQYQTISTFGTHTLLEELQINISPDFLKVKAFQRLIHTLILLIDNTVFAIKNKQDKEEIKKFRKKLKRIEKLVPLLYEIRKNNIKKTQKIIIKEKQYEELLEEVLGMKANINEYLNKSDLLFINKDEFDPAAHKERMLRDLTEKG